ncbi:MAG: hypothetical protein ABI378_03505 [Chitinophagaceae bacterium]
MLLQITEHLKEDLLQEGSLLTNIPPEIQSATTASYGVANARLVPPTAQMHPVIQLNMVPTPIDISQYANPYGPTNPNGDTISLFRFRELTNNIPDFETFYFSSGSYIEDVYANIVNGASSKPNATFTQQAFSNSIQKLANSKLAALTIYPGSWCPVFASPSDWYTQVTQKQNLFSTSLNLQDPVSSVNQDFTVIGNQGTESLDWNQINTQGKVVSTPLNKGSVLNTVSYKFMVVQINRPWLDLSLFSMGGWYLAGQDTGFVSSGDATNNNGIMPLYTTAFILATDLEITGSLQQADASLLANNLDNNEAINLGPFNISSIISSPKSNNVTLSNNGYFIVAWISKIIGLAPKIDS